MKNFVSIIAMLTLLYACNRGPETTYYDKDQGIAESRSMLAGGPVADIAMAEELPAITPTAQKKIIKDGRMELKVKSLDAAKIFTDSLVSRLGGYYASESLSNQGSDVSVHLRIRIPSNAFESLVDGVGASGGEVLYKVIDTRDVTDQFIDLESRLNTKRNYLTRYQELLKQARTVTEILEIEAQIRQLEEEIDSTTGRLRYLSDQVDFSTLNLTLTHKKPFAFTPQERERFSEKLKQSLITGWYGIVDFALMVFSLWPLWVAIVLLTVTVRRIKQRNRKQ